MKQILSIFCVGFFLFTCDRIEASPRFVRRLAEQCTRVLGLSNSEKSAPIQSAANIQPRKIISSIETELTDSTLFLVPRVLLPNDKQSLHATLSRMVSSLFELYRLGIPEEANLETEKAFAKIEKRMSDDGRRRTAEMIFVKSIPAVDGGGKADNLVIEFAQFHNKARLEVSSEHEQLQLINKSFQNDLYKTTPPIPHTITVTTTNFENRQEFWFDPLDKLYSFISDQLEIDPNLEKERLVQGMIRTTFKSVIKELIKKSFDLRLSGFERAFDELPLGRIKTKGDLLDLIDQVSSGSREFDADQVKFLANQVWENWNKSLSPIRHYGVDYAVRTPQGKHILIGVRVAFGAVLTPEGDVRINRMHRGTKHFDPDFHFFVSAHEDETLGVGPLEALPTRADLRAFAEALKAAL